MLVSIRGESYRLWDTKKAGLFSGPYAVPAQEVAARWHAGVVDISTGQLVYFSSGLDMCRDDP